jgi:Flp pilus assembly protein TadG
MTPRARGQSIVEMALILPFFLLITLGIIDLSYYVYSYSELENATRRASERASKTPPFNPGDPNDKCAQLIRAEAVNSVTLSNLQNSHISLAFVNGGQRRVGDQIEVGITYPGQFLTPVAQSVLGSTFNFRFRTVRTITSIDPPLGYKFDCSPR